MPNWSVSMLKQYVKNLSHQLSGEFQKKLLAASIQSLEDMSNPLSFNNFCAGYRELVRHVLSDLAPDAEIKACSWYVPDTTSRTGITRAHAITYLLQGGLPSAYVTGTLEIDIVEEKKELISAIKKLNKYTHVNEGTFGIEASLASAEAVLAIDSLSSVLGLANDCRAQLARALEAQIHNEVVALAISETIGAVDELATHHCVNGIDVEDVTVTKVGSEFIHLRASGTIGVELQWGSNSDLRRGEGATGNDSFPFSCELQSHVEDPAELEAIEGTLRVDTSSWWDDYYDEA